MTLPTILDDLNRLGITLDLRPGGIILMEPPEAITPNLRTRLSAARPALVTHLKAEAIAKLDAGRNERDRKAARGYDYARSQAPGYVVHASPHIDLVIEANGELRACDACGDPACIVTPYSLYGKRRFCGINCFNNARAGK